MRMIGHLESEPIARTFSEFLYVKGIRNQIEAESDGAWSIWIHSEEELDQARQLLQGYQANPSDPEIRRTAEKARDLLAREKQVHEAALKRQFNREQIFSHSMGPLTVALIALSIIVYLLREYSAARWVTDYLFISEVDTFTRDLPEVRQGQVWRVLTPIFLHFTIVHIFFNMLWMRDLGTMLESRLGTWSLLIFVVAVGVISNLAQYYVSGPAFGGMSGVVYGLLGYVWIKGRFHPESGLFLHPSTVMMMLIWLVFGYTNILPMANTVHAVGLAVGVLWGFISAKSARR